jgi:hypothetical protein
MIGAKPAIFDGLKGNISKFWPKIAIFCQNEEH